MEKNILPKHNLRPIINRASLSNISETQINAFNKLDHAMSLLKNEI